MSHHFAHDLAVEALRGRGVEYDRELEITFDRLVEALSQLQKTPFPSDETRLDRQARFLWLLLA